MHRHSRLLSFLAIGAALYACGPGEEATPDGGSIETPDAGPIDDTPVAAGELVLAIADLPAHLTPSLRVVGPDGYSEKFTEATTITGLVPGTYTVSASPVADEGGAWTSSTPRVDVEVTAEAGARVRMQYRLLTPKIRDGVRVLPASTIPAAAELTETSGRLTFPATSDAGALKAGELIVLGVTEATPSGFLGRVRTVTSAGGEVVVEADRATLGDVVEQGAISIDHEYTSQEIAGLEPTEVTEGVTVSLSRNKGTADIAYVCIELTGKKLVDTEAGKLVVNGHNCTSLAFTFDLYTEGNAVGSFLSLYTAQDGRFEVTGSGNAEVLVRKVVPLMKLKLPIIQFHVGQVPVIIQPELVMNVQVGGGVKGDFHAEVQYALRAAAATRYQDRQYRDASSAYGSADVATAGAIEGFSARVGAGPGLDFYFYGVLGPTIGADIYFAFDALVGRDPWWKILLGVDAFIGIKASAFGYFGLADFQGKVLDWAITIGHAPAGHTHPVLINLTPATVTVPACARQNFTAAVESALPSGVRWSTTGGEITVDPENDRNGRYRAPRTAGTYTVTAESTVQLGQRRSATVQVPGNGSSADAAVVVLEGPADFEPRVSILGPQDELYGHLTNAVGVPCLPPGTYRLVADAVRASDGKLYGVRVDDGAPALHVEIPFTVAAGEHAHFVVSYANAPGGLRISAEGAVLAHASPSILVEGPNGFTRTVTQADVVLASLEPGRYTLTASPIVVAGQQYVARPASLAVDVAPGGLADATFRWALPGNAGLWVLNGSGTSGALHFPDTSTREVTSVADGLFNPELNAGITHDLAFDAAGNLWVADQFQSRLARYDAATLEANPSPALTIATGSFWATHLAFDAAGNLWALQDGWQTDPPSRLVRYDAADLDDPDATPSVVVPFDAHFPSGLAFDGAGDLWVASNMTLHRFPSAALQTASPAASLSIPLPHRVLDIIPAGPTALWFGMGGGASEGIWRVPVANLVAGNVTADVRARLPYGVPHGLATDPSGNLWIPFDNGSHQFFGRGVHVLTPANLVDQHNVGGVHALPERPEIRDVGNLPSPQAAAWWSAR